MKKYIILALVLFRTFVFCQPADLETAKKIAVKAFQSKYQNGYNIKDRHIDINIPNVKIANSFTKKYNGHDSYHVINFSGGGWIVIAAHKAVNPIIAHSPEGFISENASPEFNYLMDFFNVKIDKAYNNKINSNLQYKWDSIGTLNIQYNKPSSLKDFVVTTTSGATGFYLMSTKWSQFVANDNLYIKNFNNTADMVDYNNQSAYNYYAPSQSCTTSIGGKNVPLTEGKAVAGCGPVATAQILKYWGYAQGDEADFDWWNMPDEVLYYSNYPTKNSSYTNQSHAVSYLIQTIGDAKHCNAIYGCGETDSYISNSIFTNFGYKSTTITSGSISSTTTKADLITILKNELDLKRPVLYSAGGTALTGINKGILWGHIFVCDGYLSDNTFHFNLGWGGDCNGFYDCTDLLFTVANKTQMEINLGISWTIGIQPDWQTSETIAASTIGASPLTTNETWQASTIVAGSSTNTAFVIPSGDNGRLVGAQSVQLLPGFYAQSGSTFLGRTYLNNTGGLKEYIDTMNEPASTTNESGEIAIVDNTALTIDAYPNPIINGNLTVSASKAITGKVVIELYDLLGVKVFSSTEDGLSSKQISFGSFAKGIYLLKISYNNTSIFSAKVLY